MLKVLAIKENFRIFFDFVSFVMMEPTFLFINSAKYRRKWLIFGLLLIKIRNIIRGETGNGVKDFPIFTTQTTFH